MAATGIGRAARGRRLLDDGRRHGADASCPAGTTCAARCRCSAESRRETPSAEVDVVVIGGGATGRRGAARPGHARPARAARRARRLRVGHERAVPRPAPLGRPLRRVATRSRRGTASRRTRVLRRIAPATIEPTGGYFVATPDDPDDYLERFPAACAAAGIEAEPVALDELFRRRAAPQPRGSAPRTACPTPRSSRGSSSTRTSPARGSTAPRRSGTTPSSASSVTPSGARGGGPTRDARSGEERDDRLPRGHLRRRRMGRQGGRARRGDPRT